jgi:RNA-binding protein PNO1
MAAEEIETVHVIDEVTLKEEAAMIEDANDEEENEQMKPSFQEISAVQKSGKFEKRKIPVPPHRMKPLRDQWMSIYKPIVEHMKLQIRMNQKSKSVELRTSRLTTDSGALQKAEDFVRAFMLGFVVEDAIALLRMDDLYIDTFEIQDVKRLAGANLSRAIGRISGKDGKTKFAIENSTRTRIVIADSKVNIFNF